MEVQFPFISVVVDQTRNLPAAIFAITHLVLDIFFLTYAVNAIWLITLDPQEMMSWQRWINIILVLFIYY